MWAEIVKKNLPNKMQGNMSRKKAEKKTVVVGVPQKCSGGDGGGRATNLVPTQEWKTGKYDEFPNLPTIEPEVFKYKHIVDKNGIPKCIRNDGCIGILFGRGYTSYITDVQMPQPWRAECPPSIKGCRMTKEEVKKETENKARIRNILMFSPGLIDSFLAPDLSEHDKVVQAYNFLLTHHPDLLTDPDYEDDKNDLNKILPYGLTTYELENVTKEMSPLGQYDNKASWEDNSDYVSRIQLSIQICWIPQGKRFKVIDFEGDCIIMDDNFVSA